MSLLPVAEAQARLFALARPLPAETVAVGAAVGRWLADDVAALRDQPWTDLSAMDGYAVRSDDLPGPWTIVGESAAGRPSPVGIATGEAVRIFTGAALPPGADTVLIQERALRDGSRLTLAGAGPAARGAHVRPRGLDFSEGDVLVARGERLTPARLALLGAAGHGSVRVGRRLRVALAATGDELMPPGSPLGEARLPETNRLMVAAQLADLPVDLVDLGILPDRAEVLAQTFAGVSADVLVTTGGASVGDHDLVRPALEAAGAKLDFWKVAVRPGKPLLAGTLGPTIVVGLPGNPVSAFVTALLFVRPLLAQLAGAADPLPRHRSARLGAPLPANGERTDFLRAHHRDGGVVPAARQDSAMLRVLSHADCLILRAPFAPPAMPGESIEVLDIA